MRVTIAAIGRDRAGPARQLFEDYRKRSPGRSSLIEIAAAEPAAARAPPRRGGARLLAIAAARARVAVALDEHGRQLDSLAFARRLGAWRDQGTAEIAFLIGGPDGLAAAVLRARGIGRARSAR